MILLASAVATVLLVFALLTAIPTAVFCLEIVGSIAGRRRDVEWTNEAVVPTAAVIVPAHNEHIAILPTIRDLQRQLGPTDKLMIVADNCTDDTAEIARGAGVEVSERNCPDKIGKGYALDWGVRQLGDFNADVIVFVDADCRLQNDALKFLKLICVRKQRPVQALYSMASMQDSPINLRVAQFAWRVKNELRPSGLKACGLPCQLMGTGMAVPRGVLARVSLASGNLVEDLGLGLDLARAGAAPLFCPRAVVSSQFPVSAEGVESQRRRWEHGHLQMIVKHSIPSLWQAIRKGNLDLFVLALDLMVPPVTLLGLLLIASLLVSLLAASAGFAKLPFYISLGSLLSFCVAIATCWVRVGAEVLPLSSLGLILRYGSQKLRLYRQALSGFESQWVRTRRQLADEKEPKEDDQL